MMGRKHSDEDARRVELTPRQIRDLQGYIDTYRSEDSSAEEREDAAGSHEHSRERRPRRLPAPTPHRRELAVQRRTDLVGDHMRRLRTDPPHGDAVMTDDEIEVSELVDRMDDADRAACLGETSR